MKATDRHFVEEVSCVLEGVHEVMRVANLSVGGLFAATQNPPAAGETVTIELRLPKHNCWLTGRVTWINEPKSPITPALPEGFGMMFNRVPPGDQAAIREILRQSEIMMSPSSARGSGV
jgi:Tfp pilus assembly protein PilZ